MVKSSARVRLVWEQFEKLGAGKGNNFPISCRHCNKQFVGNTSRLLTHLTGEGTGVSTCKSMPAETVEALKAMTASIKATIAVKKRDREVEEEVLLQDSEPIVTVSSSSSNGSNKKLKQASIQQVLSTTKLEAARKAVAKFFFTEGIPINKSRSWSFREMMAAVAAAGSGFVPPSYDILRTKYLVAARSDIDSKLAVFDMRTSKCGSTLSSDGWDDAANHPLINFLLINPVGVKFVDAVDTSGEPKTSVYIASKFIQAIELVGPDNVVLVVTDGAAANCGAFPLIKHK